MENVGAECEQRAGRPGHTHLGLGERGGLDARTAGEIKPIAHTDSCQAAHLGYFVSGRMKVVVDDGEEMEYGPGDLAVMAPGHDAWIIGDEPCVVIDWQGFADYAKR